MRLPVTSTRSSSVVVRGASCAPATPPELPDYLRNYQRRGVEWMHHLCETECHGLLADDLALPEAELERGVPGLAAAWREGAATTRLRPSVLAR